MSTQLNDVLTQMFGQEFADAPTPAVTMPTCSECGDTGYIRYDVPYGDERFGHMYRCANPNCPTTQRMFAEQSQRVANLSTWEEVYGGWTFESYKQLIHEVGQDKWEGKRGALAAAYAFAVAQGVAFTLNQAAQVAWKQDWKGKVSQRASQSVILTGDVGLGKTGLAVAAVNELRSQSQSVIFIRVQELIRRLQETYNRDWQGETADTRSRFYASVPYLIIDEFGMKNFSTDRLELIENIIRERDRRGLPFMATTNLSKDEFYAGWQPQIADIVAKAHWVQIGGVKLRQTATKTEMW